MKFFTFHVIQAILDINLDWIPSSMHEFAPRFCSRVSFIFLFMTFMRLISELTFKKSLKQIGMTLAYSFWYIYCL